VLSTLTSTTGRPWLRERLGKSAGLAGDLVDGLGGWVRVDPGLQVDDEERR
jgi:hypothetical protein